MAFTEVQMRLKDQFVQAHGYWNPTWEPILEAIPEQFAVYVEFSAVPYRSGKLTPKVREFISIAVNVSMTLMNQSAVRVHVQNALRLGATREELLEVFGICTVLGIHSVSYPLPILLKEMERRGQPFEVTFSARAREVQEAWVKKRGYWPSSFDTLLSLDPEFVAAYSSFSDAPRTDGPLDQKTVELICVAIDGSSTHLFDNGIRTHGMAALNNGASLEEILESLELASVTGIQSMVVGVAVLDEEIAKLADQQE